MAGKAGKIKGGARFVRFYPSDWRSGCIGLSLEQEGFYIRICAFIYETARRLPEDDSQAAKFIGVHTNAYRKIRDQLSELGKIQLYSDGWSVPRAERELELAVGHGIAADTEGGLERQDDTDEGRKAGQDTLGDTHHNTPIDTPHNTGWVFPKFMKENNGPLIEPIANSQKPDKQTVSLDDEIIAEVCKAMGPGENFHQATAWLGNLTKLNGAEAVAQAYQALLTSRAEKRPVARVLPWLSTTAASLKSRPTGSRSSSSGTPTPVHKVSPDTVRFAKPRFDDEVKANA